MCDLSRAYPVWLTGRANTRTNLLLGENKMRMFYVYSRGVGGVSVNQKGLCLSACSCLMRKVL